MRRNNRLYFINGNRFAFHTEYFVAVVKIKIYYKCREMMTEQHNYLLCLRMIINICFKYLNHDILFIYHSDGFFDYSFQLFLSIFDLFHRIQINQSPILVISPEQFRSDFYKIRMMKNKNDFIFCFR